MGKHREAREESGTDRGTMKQGHREYNPGLITKIRAGLESAIAQSAKALRIRRPRSYSLLYFGASSKFEPQCPLSKETSRS